jgi:hypothetical protein
MHDAEKLSLHLPMLLLFEICYNGQDQNQNILYIKNVCNLLDY